MGHLLACGMSKVCMLLIILCPLYALSKVLKLQAAIKFAEEDLPNAKVSL